VHDFTYTAASTVDEALRGLADGAKDPRILAGGTDLLIQMRAGVRRPRHLIDVKRIPELNALECDAGRGLRFGAAVPCWRIAEDPAVRALFPGLAEAAALIGSTQIQNRATVVGNLCNGSPAADTSPALLALGAECVVASVRGRRTFPLAELHRAPGRTCLAADELLVELRVPAPPPRASDCYRRLIPRNEMDIAVVGVGAAIALDGERCSAARIALGAVGPRPILAVEAAQALVGTALDDASLEAAGRAAAAVATPIDDMRGTAEYRRDVVAVLTRRVAAEAAARARRRG
jgi:aerobic carbon-monoxide dehydrogenase medium subunit